ncbi:MAG: hypothetical protein LBK01_01145 [Burkholderiaceae bacterium]|jgi:folate-binding protein YgfZ|nr:hypothetical protein [Burkholderiaceae bacterium]
MPATDIQEQGFVATLFQSGLLRVSGDDAAPFLQGQITHDVLSLPEGTPRLAGYCTPQGLLLAILLLWRSNDAIWLMMPSEILPAVRERLQHHVLRAKVLIADASEQVTLLGLGGKAAQAMVSHRLPDTALSGDGEMAPSPLPLPLPSAFGAPRFLLAVPVNNVRFFWKILTETLVSTGPASWELADITAGLPQVFSATRDAFFPQALNLDLLDGMSFQKGCYVGQEAIAARQNTGEVTHRMRMGHIPMPPNNPSAQADILPGTPVFADGDAQACGLLVRIAPLAAQVNCLFTLRNDLVHSDRLCVGTPQGPPIRLDALPYDIPRPPKRGSR